MDQDLRAQWNTWDHGDETARQASQKTMVALLDRRRYLSNLVRDVTETLDGKTATAPNAAVNTCAAGFTHDAAESQKDLRVF